MSRISSQSPDQSTDKKIRSSSMPLANDSNVLALSYGIDDPNKRSPLLPSPNDNDNDNDNDDNNRYSNTSSSREVFDTR